MSHAPAVKNNSSSQLSLRVAKGVSTKRTFYGYKVSLLSASPVSTAYIDRGILFFVGESDMATSPTRQSMVAGGMRACPASTQP